jgi:hypothetical protein
MISPKRRMEPACSVNRQRGCRGVLFIELEELAEHCRVVAGVWSA